MIVFYLCLIFLKFLSTDENLFLEKMKSSISLKKPESIETSELCLNKLKLNETIDGNFYLILNNLKTKYLKAYQYEGDINYSISLFEIGFIENKIDLNKLFYVLTDNQDFFETPNGLKLGLNKKEVEYIFNNLLIKKKDYFYFELENPLNLKLIEYNMPKYFIEIYFENEIVKNYTFGFEYP